MKKIMEFVLLFLMLCIFNAVFIIFAVKHLTKTPPRPSVGVPVVTVTQSSTTEPEDYEWFYDRYHAILAGIRKADLARSEAERTSIKMMLASLIEEYNAKADIKMQTERWQAMNLPNHLDWPGEAE